MRVRFALIPMGGIPVFDRDEGFVYVLSSDGHWEGVRSTWRVIVPLFDTSCVPDWVVENMGQNGFDVETEESKTVLDRLLLRIVRSIPERQRDVGVLTLCHRGEVTTLGAMWSALPFTPSYPTVRNIRPPWFGPV